MDSSNPSQLFETYKFTIFPGDPFEDLRSPEHEYGHALEKIWWQWRLYEEGSAMPGGFRHYESYIILNTQLGRLDLATREIHVRGDDLKQLRGQEQFVMMEGFKATERLGQRAKCSILVNELFKSGKLRYLTQADIDKLPEDDKICGILLEELKETESKDWADPMEAPMICFPEWMDRFESLGQEERDGFERRLTEIWEEINALPDASFDDFPDSEIGPINALAVCCQDLALAIKKSALKLTSGAEAEAQIQEELRSSSATTPLEEFLLHQPVETRTVRLLVFLGLWSLFWICREWLIRVFNKFQGLIPSRQVKSQTQEEPRPSSVLTVLEELPDTNAFDELVPAEQAIQTDCGHRYGIVSFSSWLMKSKLCPTCRRRMDPPKFSEGLETLYDNSFKDQVQNLFGGRLPQESIEEFYFLLEFPTYDAKALPEIITPIEEWEESVVPEIEQQSDPEPEHTEVDTVDNFLFITNNMDEFRHT